MGWGGGGWPVFSALLMVLGLERGPQIFEWVKNFQTQPNAAFPNRKQQQRDLLTNPQHNELSLEQRPHLSELLREGAQVQLLTQGLFLSSCLPVLGTAFKSLVN